MTDSHVKSVSPKALQDFVKSLGWKPVDDASTDKVCVFANPHIEKRQLRIPLNDTLADYDEAVNLALAKLSEIQNQPLDALRAQIYRATEDMISYRVIESQGDAIPFPFALSIMNGAKDLLLAAAHSVVKPQRYHQRLNRAEPLELLRKTNFRHTQSGSFILNVSVPLSAVEAEVSQTPDLFEESPMVRQTTKLIYNALDRLLHAIETNTVEQTLDEDKEQPWLSANFCNALLLFEGEDDIELQVNWATLKPEPVTPKPLRLKQQYFPKIEAIKKDLTPSAISAAPKLYIGTVERLDGYESENGQREGDIILSLFDLDEETFFKAKASLNIHQYALATKAHNPTKYVMLEGTVREGKQPRIITNISRFELFPKPQSPSNPSSDRT